MDSRFRNVVCSLCAAGAERRRSLCFARLEEHPRCPVARFLIGCDAFDQGQPATGVRSMMIAYHADPTLESAALLVFAGLDWIQNRSRPLLDVLVRTWEEFRRPEFDRTPHERFLLDALSVPADGWLDRVSPLARRLWRLPLETIRRQLRDVAQRPEADDYPLLISPV